jgi:hypothetical protein
MDRKKELKMQYKQMKPQMGVFIIRSKSNNKYYIEGTQDLRGTMNGARFKLDAGGHPNRELQQEWVGNGPSDFTIEVLENLEYDKDESKTDYMEDLALLQMIWEEKLAKEGMEIYKRNFKDNLKFIK